MKNTFLIRPQKYSFARTWKEFVFNNFSEQAFKRLLKRILSQLPFCVSFRSAQYPRKSRLFEASRPRGNKAGSPQARSATENNATFTNRRACLSCTQKIFTARKIPRPMQTSKSDERRKLVVVSTRITREQADIIRAIAQEECVSAGKTAEFLRKLIRAEITRRALAPRKERR